jgi:hypothetical protein
VRKMENEEIIKKVEEKVLKKYKTRRLIGTAKVVFIEKKTGKRHTHWCNEPVVNRGAILEAIKLTIDDTKKEIKKQTAEQIFDEVEHLIVQNKMIIRNRKLKAGSYDLKLSYINGSNEGLSNLAEDVKKLKAKLLEGLQV